MSRCRLPELCHRYKIDIGSYDPKSKRILPRNIKQKDECVHIQKKSLLCCLEKSREDSLLNVVEEIDMNFKFV